MLALISNVDFWKAISAMLWPIVALVIFLLLRTKLATFFNRDSITIKVAGMEISVADVAKRAGEDVAALQKRLAELETRLSASLAPNFINNGSSKLTSEIPNSNEERPLTSIAASEIDRRPFRILWVDDYPANNAFLLEQFRLDGIEAIPALTTEEGLNAFQSEKFDLIITDLGRRENGVSQPYAGVTLIKEIRKIDGAIPILVYAGPRGVENMVRLKKAGANFVSQSAVELQKVVMYYRQPMSGK